METAISLSNTGILTKDEYDESQLVKGARDDGLDRTAFLTLLTTQLQNQNPLDPMKNEQFVAQLAQFSQLEGITNMSTSLSEVADVIRSDRIMAGANLVGKSVFGQTGRINSDGVSAADIEFELPYGADQVEVGIYDPVSGGLM
jgi:flagellar basal-body rod modification protein FlgD